MPGFLLSVLLILMMVSSGCNNPSGGSVIRKGNAPFLKAPAAFNFTQIRAKNGNIDITWQQSKRAARYDFYMGTSSSSITERVDECSGGLEESCELTGLDPNTVYYFDVKATNDVGSKKISSIASALSVGLFNITSSSPSDGTITLAWDPADNATGYNIIFGTRSGIYTLSRNNVTSPYTISGLTNGVDYYVKVVGINSQNGYSPSTNEINQQPFGPLPPPSGLALTATSGQISLNWRDLSGASYYKVYRGLTASSLSEIATNVLTSNYTDNSISDGTPYFYAVVAYNGFDSQKSTIVSAQAISNFNITSAVAGPAPSQVTLTWPTPTGATAFDVRFGTNPSSLTGVKTNVTSPYTITGLTGGLTYYFKVIAKNSVGAGTTLFSTNQLSQVPVPPLPAPTNLTAEATPATIELNWNTVAGASSYKVFRGTTSGSLTEIASNLLTTSYTDNPVTNGTTYYYTVRAFNGYDSVSSAQVQKRPIDNFSFTSANVTSFKSVDVSWNAATGASGYDILYGTTPGVYSGSSLNRTSPATLTGLSGSTTYYIAIRAKNSVGGSTTVISNERSITTTTTYPTVSITTFPLINNANKASYTVSGSCSENSRNVTVTIGSVSTSVTCSSLAWSATLNVTSVPDSATRAITAVHTNSGGNSDTDTKSVVKDTANPTVAITSYPAINNTNKDAYTFSGTCSENSRNVSINIGGITSNQTCSSLAWSATLDVSSLADNSTVNITADMSDAAGNSATQATRIVEKDTAIPSVAITSTPIINNANKSGYTFSGTCSESGRNVSLKVGSTSGTAVCTSSSWTATLNVSLNADSGTLLITADHTDSSNNAAVQSTATVIKDTVNPTVAITSSPIIKNANKAAYIVSGTCSENGKNVSVSVGGVTDTPTCSSSTWTTTLDVTGVSDSSSIAVSATHLDNAGNTKTASTTVVKNTNLPTVAITSSPIINSTNKGSYTVSGTCSENSRPVTVNVGGVNANPTCSSQAWTATLNVATVSDNANVSITADHSDTVGNNAGQASIAVVKDTVIPTVTLSSGPAVTNANKTSYTVSGTCSEDGRNVSVLIGTIDVTPVCNSGTWTSTVDASSLSDTATLAISANHADAAGNNATSASTTVVKDTSNPTVAINAPSPINSSNQNAYTVSGTCSENGRQVEIDIGGLTATPTCSASAWTVTLDLSGISDSGTISITANHDDAAGNNATQASRTVSKDTAIPTVAITSSPVINSSNKTSYTVNGTCSDTGTDVIVKVGTIDSTVSCTLLTWSVTIDISGNPDSRSLLITADQTDEAGNTALQAGVTVVKDTVNPSLSITSAPLINNANKASYTISGTCSENTRGVAVNVGGVTDSPVCSGLAWTTTLNVTGVADSDFVSITVAHTDSAGNAVNTSSTVVKNTGLPTVAITSVPAINNANKTSYPLSGTCSDDGQAVSINVGGVTATPVCTSLTWSTSLDVSMLSDNSSISVTADHTDASGNPATQAATTVIKDTVSPTVAITSAPSIINSNKSSYPLSGTCSDNSSVVSVNVGGVTASPTCSSGTWSASLDMNGVSDGTTISVTVNHLDPAGNTAPEAATDVVKDTVNPTVTITTYPVINNANSASYTVSGTCSENTRTVNLSVGGVTATPTCSSAAWSATVDLSSLADSSSVSITADHSDSAGNSATQASRSIAKDTVDPTVAITSVPSINNSNKGNYPLSGTCSENTRAVSVNVGGVSSTPTCSSGSWSTSLNVSGVTDNASISVTVNHSDASGNAATTVSTTVLKDTVIPTVAISSAPLINNSNKTSYPISGTCSENTRTVTINVGGVSATPTCSSLAWSATLNVSSVGDGSSISVTANHSDLAGNNATAASTTVVKDTLDPTLAITSTPVINNGNKSSYTLSGSCSENSQAVSVSVGGVTATPTCSSSTWSITLDVSGVSDGSSIAITANHSDANGNPAPEASTTIVKDTVAPTVAISSAPDIYNSNKGSYTVSGTCSENTKNVIVSIGGSLFSATCTSLAWSTGSVNVGGVSDSSNLTITANHADAAGNSASEASTTVVKDTSNPSIAITSSPVINNSNKSSYTVSGTCSETGENVAIKVGSVTTSDTCTLLTWSATVDVSGNPDSTTLLITADHTDAVGNSAVQAGITVVKDTVDPTVTIASAPTINNSNRSSYTVSGTCSENTRTVSVTVGGLSASPVCTSLAWTTSMDVTSLSDSGSLEVTANHTDAAGNQANEDSVTILKDTSNPTVAITSAPDINISNKASYTVSGSCSEDTRSVEVEIGTLSYTLTCSSLSWSTGAVDVSSLSDSGALVITADHTDANGNSATQDTASIIKDTVKPGVSLSTSEPATTSSSPFVVRATFTEATSGISLTDFSVTNATAGILNVISSTVYEISVSPSAEGTVTINFAQDLAIDIVGNNNTAATQLSRYYVPPAVLTFDAATTYDFGNVNIGDSADVTFLISKTGTPSATSVTEIALSAPFAFKGGSFPGTGGTCTTTISGTCSVVIRYTPTTAAVHNDSIQLQYNNGAATVSVSRSLTGTGILVTPTHSKIEGPAGIQINQCVAYTIYSTTSSGGPARVTANQTVNLVVNNSSGTSTRFYSNSSCGTSVTSTIISSGTSSKVVYLRSTTANQSLTIVANPASLLPSTLDVSTTNAPSKIDVTLLAEMETSKCLPLSINLVDSSGAKVGKSTAVQVNLAKTGAAVYYSDENCTGIITSVSLPAHTETKTVYVRDYTEQTVTLTFSDNAGSLTSDSGNVTFVDALTWWNTAYSNRLPIIINNQDQAAAHTNIPVLIKLDSSKLDYDDIQSNGEDIRFTLDDHSTTLSYEIENWDSSGESLVWVKIPSLSANANRVIYMYFNNPVASDGQNASSAWTGFSGVWNMKKSGANYVDSTGSGKTGMTEGTVADVTGPIGNAIYVNGSSDIDVGYDLSQIIGRTSTFSFWMKSTQSGSNTAYLAPGITGVEEAGGGNDIFFGWISGSGTIRVSSGNGNFATSDFIVNDNSWRFVTMTRNESNGDVSFYVNGVLNGTGRSESGYKSTPFSKFGVITDTGGGPMFFNGSMDGIRLTNSIQSDARIKAEYKYSTGNNVSFGSPEDL